MGNSFIVRRRAAALLAVALVAAVGCAPEPEGPLPDPIASCISLDGSITYDPPASNAGVDVTLTVQPGAGLTGCVSNTSVLVDDAALSGHFVLPAFTCGIKPEDAEIGTGTGRLAWSNGRTSDFTARLLSPGTQNEFVLELHLVGGLWAGATSSTRLGVVSSVGNCVQVPVSSAVLTSTERFELHPAATVPVP